MATFAGWEQAVLAGIGAPLTAANVTFLDAWQSKEGGSAAFNPLNTTQTMGGSSSYNSLGGGIGVQSYQNASDGAAATVATLGNGYYPTIVAALKSGNPFASSWTSGMAGELSKWSGGGYSSIPDSGGNASAQAGTALATSSSGAPSETVKPVSFTAAGLTMAIVVVVLLLVLTGLGQFTGSSSAPA